MFEDGFDFDPSALAVALLVAILSWHFLIRGFEFVNWFWKLLSVLAGFLMAYFIALKKVNSD